MLKSFWTLLFGKSKPRYPDGEYLVIKVLGPDSYSVVYNAENIKEAEREVKARVKSCEDSFLIAPVLSKSSFEVKLKPKKK